MTQSISTSTLQLPLGSGRQKLKIWNKFRVFAVFSLACACARSAWAADELATSVIVTSGKQISCVASVVRELKGMNSFKENYDITITKDGDNLKFEMSAPVPKDIYRDPVYFGGGAIYICDSMGKIVRREFDR